MKITLKMYASLAQFLPPEAVRNVVEIDIPDTCSVHEVIARYQVPRASAHLVLINGVYVEPEQRDAPLLRAGDVLALWPPVAGG
ncbi:MAG: MoaD/ThiS family protein [Gammaproteobacteria bacterium]